MRAQLERFLDFDAAPNAARMMNNADWLRADRPARIPARHRQALHRELHDGEGIGEAPARRARTGISFTEFSYLLLQAHDYLHCIDATGCTLQMGGSDQWGNITAGSDLIRKVRGGKAHGLVLPLHDDVGGHQVRQDRSGHGVARSRAHAAFRLLPVLAQHRRSRRDQVPEVLHVARSRRD